MERDINKPLDTNRINPAKTPGPDMSRTPVPHMISAGTVIGDDVYNTRDEAIGDIKEIMLDTQSGSVVYAVVAVGGFLGISNRLLAVPWKSLKLDPAKKRFIMDISKERVKDAPGFDKDRWPDMADPAWNREVQNFYGVTQH